MAILHYQITENQQDIQINAGIHSQNFIFRRAIVKMNPLAGTTSINGGGIIVQPSHFSGMEIVTDTKTESNDLLLGLDEDKMINNIYYDMEFDSEDISEAFTVKVLKFNREDGLAEFGAGAGKIRSIDLYFQFSSLYNYDTVY